MSNGLCDIYGHPASVRVNKTENGFRKVKELCDEYYVEISVQAPLADKFLSQELSRAIKSRLAMTIRVKPSLSKYLNRKVRNQKRNTSKNRAGKLPKKENTNVCKSECR